jgi:hypothetical protein
VRSATGQPNRCTALRSWRSPLQLYRRFLVAGTIATLATTPASAMDHDGPQFREPGSGHRVTAYTIELATGVGDVSRYEIPTDCAEVLARIDAGERYRPTLMLRRAWHKAESDCRFYQLLQNNRPHPVQDYISSYDFANAALDDLPIANFDAPPNRAAARPQDARIAGMVERLPLAMPIEAAGDTLADDCRLRDGLLRGSVFIGSKGKIRCSKGDGRPTLRLIAVDHADINGDRVMDAILRFVFLQPGMPRGPMILALTRDRADGPLRVISPQAPRVGADKE